MPIQTRLELNGKPVQNRFLRSLLSIVILVILAVILLVIGTILLPIFIGLVAVIAIGGGIFLYRIRKRIASLKNYASGPGSPSSTSLDPTLEVRVERAATRKEGSASSKSIE